MCLNCPAFYLITTNKILPSLLYFSLSCLIAYSEGTRLELERDTIRFAELRLAKFVLARYAAPPGLLSRLSCALSYAPAVNKINIRIWKLKYYFVYGLLNSAALLAILVPLSWALIG